jgi:hypothetical protein
MLECLYCVSIDSERGSNIFCALALILMFPLLVLVVHYVCNNVESEHFVCRKSSEHFCMPLANISAIVVSVVTILLSDDCWTLC